MKVTFKQFVNDYDIELSKCKLCYSETQLYEGSDIHVTFISLNKPIENQDSLVLSKELAEIFYENNDVKVLKGADAIHDEEHGWGLICHSYIKTHDVDLSTIFSDLRKENATFRENDNKDEIDLIKLKEALYRLKERVDENSIHVPLFYKYDAVILDTNKNEADIDYVEEDEHGYYGTSHLSGDSFRTSILDNIDSFVEKYNTIIRYRKIANSLNNEIIRFAEEAIMMYDMPDIKVDFSSKIITLDDNYYTDLEEDGVYYIGSKEYGDFICKEDDDGGLLHYKKVDYDNIRKVSRQIVEEQYKIDLYEVEY